MHNHLVLSCEHFPRSPTGEAIKEQFCAKLQIWEIDITKVHLIAWDNGTNIVKGCNDAGVNSVSCFIHTIQLVVMGTINSQMSISDLIAVCSHMVTHFNN